MTAIAAIKESGAVIMGGDAAGVAGWRLTVRRDPKVFRCGPFLIGYTSSFRMAQLIRFGLHDCLQVYDLQPPATGDTLAFMCEEFIPHVRWLLKQGGFASISNNEESAGTFLVAWLNHLFMVEGDFQVAELADPFAACGCGCDVALGALHVLSGMPIESDVKIHKALLAAERFSAGVRGPFTILSTATECA
jgi:ATP-dependent protease HslVU (ClpYQ) peptidase subunit